MKSKPRRGLLITNNTNDALIVKHNNQPEIYCIPSFNQDASLTDLDDKGKKYNLKEGQALGLCNFSQ